MRTTITIDDNLYHEAVEAVGVENTSRLVSKALEILISVESTKRLLALSGKTPGFSVSTRDRKVAEKRKKYPKK